MRPRESEIAALSCRPGMDRGMGRGVSRRATTAVSSHCRRGETSRRCGVTTGRRRLDVTTGPGEKTGRRRGTPMGREETRWRTGRCVVTSSRSHRGGTSRHPGMVRVGLGGSTRPPRTSGDTRSRPGGPVRHACCRAAAALAAAAPAPAPAAAAAAAVAAAAAAAAAGVATAMAEGVGSMQGGPHNISSEKKITSRLCRPSRRVHSLRSASRQGCWWPSS